MPAFDPVALIGRQNGTRSTELVNLLGEFLAARGCEVFEGRVSRIADTVDATTRTVKVQAELDNRTGALRPEMYGSIHHIESTRPTTVVPAGAVIQSGDRSVVFVETKAGRFEPRTVSLGARAGDVIRIVSGVSPGDAVVTDGAMLLQGLLRRS